MDAAGGEAPSARGGATDARAATAATAAILLDRDGTLVVDVPYNGDPAMVEPVPGARAALDVARAAGVPMAVVSNQSGIARGLITIDDVERVHRRVEELVGPIGPMFVCPHAPDDGCDCRKPRPGLVARAAEALRVPAERCVLIGDIGSDVDAAVAAGARPILVPTDVTRPEEVARAPEVAATLEEAIRLALRDATGAGAAVDDQGYRNRYAADVPRVSRTVTPAGSRAPSRGSPRPP